MSIYKIFRKLILYIQYHKNKYNRMKRKIKMFEAFLLECGDKKMKKEKCSECGKKLKKCKCEKGE